MLSIQELDSNTNHKCETCGERAVVIIRMGTGQSALCFQHYRKTVSFITHNFIERVDRILNK